MSNVIGKDVAKDSYDEWCKAWNIGTRREYLKGDDLEQVEIQEEMIIGLICKGHLEFDGNVLNYTPIKEIGALPVVKISEPTGAMLSAGDRFKEHESGKRSIAMLASMSGEAEKVIGKLSMIDTQNLMAVMGHFLMA